MQMLVLYVFISCEFSRWRVSPKIATRETSGAKQEASNILKPSLNYLLFRPKHHNFPSSHCLFFGSIYISSKRRSVSQSGDMANAKVWLRSGALLGAGSYHPIRQSPAGYRDSLTTKDPDDEHFTLL